MTKREILKRVNEKAEHTYKLADITMVGGGKKHPKKAVLKVFGAAAPVQFYNRLGRAFQVQPQDITVSADGNGDLYVSWAV